MDAILVVNAGSSSIKFQIFEIGSDGRPQRLVKGQMDGIGSRPRLRADANDKSSLIDKEFAPKEIPDVPAAMAAVGDWLRETQSFVLVGVGHRVVHGGPVFDKPIVVNQDVLKQLQNYVSLAPLHQPNNLAPIQLMLERRPGVPQVACFDTVITLFSQLERKATVPHQYVSRKIPTKFRGEAIRRWGEGSREPGRGRDFMPLSAQRR